MYRPLERFVVVFDKIGMKGGNKTRWGVRGVGHGTDRMNELSYCERKYGDPEMYRVTNSRTR